MAACRITWPNKSDVPKNTGLWTSMEDLQNYIREIGMKEAIYDDDFESPGLVKFSAGMMDFILQQAPPHWYGTLVSILNPLQGTSEVIIQQAAQLVSDLGETECLQTRRNIWTLEGVEILPVTKTRRLTPWTPQLGPVRVFWKQMFNDLIQVGVQIAKIDHQPNHVFLQLWRQLKGNQRFQNHPQNLGENYTDKLPTATWNLEYFMVPCKRKKPPQVTWATLPEPPEGRELAIVQLLAWQGMSVPL